MPPWMTLRSVRIERFYAPYHQAIEASIDEGVAGGEAAGAARYSQFFTQAWKSVPRPWARGVLWDNDPRLACALHARA